MRKLKLRTPWLLLDCNFLCHRALHTTGGLINENEVVGTIFGFLRSLESLTDEFDSGKFVFCFDSKSSKRKEIYPGYKSAREEKRAQQTDEENATYAEMKRQLTKLRREYLPYIGYKNIFVQKGYEADDIIGSIALNTLPDINETGVIVASDQDYYQCLGPLVSMYKPIQSKRYTYNDFREEWNVDPVQWAMIKSYAGCTSDSVTGLKGVGEKTAAKWVRGELKKGTKAYEKFLAPGTGAILQNNLKVVKLPMEGTKRFDLVEDKVDFDRWDDLMVEMGMSSLIKDESRKPKPKARKRKKVTRKKAKARQR